MSDFEFPEKLADVLFEPHRYLVLYGGRGGAKSWGVARSLLLRGLSKPLRVLCAREFQNSMKDSVHRLLADQIDAMDLGHHYRVLDSEIRGANGTEFAFRGMRHNVSGIRSFEGANVVWIEEAQTVSHSSWETLIPTIRRDDSQIIITMNPDLATDETYARFVLNPPPDAAVVKINWSDNPWFPSVLRREMEHLKATDPDAWLNVWQGEPRQALTGAVYAAELRAATEAGRITRVPYDPIKPVQAFWDLGFADQTSIWIAQVIGFETRVVDFIEGSQMPLQHYLKELQGKPYVYACHWLPHDARARALGTGRSVEEMVRGAGHNVRIVPQLTVADGIAAARAVWPNIWIDGERCADGINSLRHYRYEVSETVGNRVGLKQQPVHDIYSHAADAFRYMCLALREPAVKKVKVERGPVSGGSWMA